MNNKINYNIFNYDLNKKDIDFIHDEKIIIKERLEHEKLNNNMKSYICNCNKRGLYLHHRIINRSYILYCSHCNNQANY